MVAEIFPARHRARELATAVQDTGRDLPRQGSESDRSATGAVAGGSCESGRFDDSQFNALPVARKGQLPQRSGSSFPKGNCRGESTTWLRQSVPVCWALPAWCFPRVQGGVPVSF